MTNGIEDNLKLFVIFFLKIIQSSCQVFMGCNHFAQFYKSPYDVNVTSIARSLFNTLDSIATPGSVKTYGR